MAGARSETAATQQRQPACACGICCLPPTSMFNNKSAPTSMFKQQEINLLAAVRERLQLQYDHESAAAARKAARVEACHLLQEQQPLQAALATALAEQQRAAARAEQAENEAAEHLTSLRRNADELATTDATCERKLLEKEEEMKKSRAQLTVLVSLKEQLADAQEHAAHLAKELGAARGSLAARQREIEDATGFVAEVEAKLRASDARSEASKVEVQRLLAANGLQAADMIALSAQLAEAQDELVKQFKLLECLKANAVDDARRARLDAYHLQRVQSERAKQEDEWRARVESATALAERLEQELDVCTCARTADRAADERVATVEATLVRLRKALDKAETERDAALRTSAEQAAVAAEAKMSAEMHKAKAAAAVETASIAKAQAESTEAKLLRQEAAIELKEAALKDTPAALLTVGAQRRAEAKLEEAEARAAKLDKELKANKAEASKVQTTIETAKANADKVAEARHRALRSRAEAEAEELRKQLSSAQDTAERNSAKVTAAHKVEIAEMLARVTALDAKLADAEARAGAAEVAAAAASFGQQDGPEAAASIRKGMELVATCADGHRLRTTELWLLVSSQEAELANTRRAWATRVLASAFEKALLMKAFVAMCKWRAASCTIGCSEDGGRCNVSAVERLAAAADVGFDDSIPINPVACTMSAVHEAESYAEEVNRRVTARQARLVQMQQREQAQTRLGWATYSLRAHLATRAQLIVASALCRWQQACAQVGTTRCTSLPMGRFKLGLLTDSSAVESICLSTKGIHWSTQMRQTMADLVCDGQRERQALATSWATAKLRLALARARPWFDVEALQTALRVWRVAAAAEEKKSLAVVAAVAAPSSARAFMQEGYTNAAVDHQREVAVLVSLLRCAALRSFASHERCQDNCSLQRALFAWRQLAGYA